MSLSPIGITEIPAPPTDGYGRRLLTGPDFEGGFDARLRCLAAAIMILHKSIRVRLPLLFYPQTAYEGGPRYIYQLPVPVDLAWLRTRAVLPEHLALVDSDGAGTHVRSGRLIVSSLQDPHAGNWSNNEWRTGHDYAGLVPGQLPFEPGDGSGLGPLGPPVRQEDGTSVLWTATWRGVDVSIGSVDDHTAWILAPNRPDLDPGGWTGDPRDRPGYARRVPRVELSDARRRTTPGR